jgi:pSer/pThr/pTyr-binding forkhead associated (FHA) protein
MTEPLTSLTMKYLRNPQETERSLEGPFLLFEPVLKDSENSDEMYRFKTISGVMPVSLKSGEPVVFTVRKTKDNAFQRGVTVGRTSNNDLVLDDPSISRFHAWFQGEGEHDWSVVDAVSKNGTFVNGELLKPKQPMRIGDDVKIRFGTVEVTFLSVNALLKLIRARIQS